MSIYKSIICVIFILNVHSLYAKDYFKEYVLEAEELKTPDVYDEFYKYKLKNYKEIEYKGIDKIVNKKRTVYEVYRPKKRKFYSLGAIKRDSIYYWVVAALSDDDFDITLFSIEDNGNYLNLISLYITYRPLITSTLIYSSVSNLDNVSRDKITLFSSFFFSAGA